MKKPAKYIAAIIAAAVMLSAVPFPALAQEEPSDGTVIGDVTGAEDESNESFSDENNNDGDSSDENDNSEGSSEETDNEGNMSNENINDENSVGDDIIGEETDNTDPEISTLSDDGDAVPLALFEGEGNGSSPYVISTAEDLKKLAEEVNGGNDYKGKFFKITADINLEGKWTPIGTYNDNPSTDKPFSGSIDGKKPESEGGIYSIKGLNVDNTSTLSIYSYGLFGYIKDGTIKNINVPYGYVGGKENVGGVVGYNDGGWIENCYNGATVSGNDNVGGIVGYSNSGTVTKCTNSGTVTGNNVNVGGIAGYNGGTVTGCTNNKDVTGIQNYAGGIVGYNNGTIENCNNSSAVEGEKNSVGGIAGYNNSGTITGCTNSASVTGGSDVGGVAGTNESGTITGCTNSASVSGGNSAGGVVGNNNAGSGTAKVENCNNTGVVSGASEVGGVVGNNNANADVTSSYNRGNVTGTGNNVGGVAGSSSSSIGSSYNTGGVKGSSNVGGVVGDNSGTAQKCYNTGKVEGSSAVGGVVGNSSGTTENCYNTGDVTGTSNVGGVAGNVSSGTLEKCYNIGMISGGKGVAGSVSGTVSGCYYLTGTAASGDAGEISSEAFETEETFTTFTGWDFINTWKIGRDANGNAVRPVFTEPEEKNIVPLAGPWSMFNGEGTDENPYTINNRDELIRFCNYVRAGSSGKDTYFKLTNNIDLSGINWKPIGIYIEKDALNSTPFEGTFDGNKKEIRGMKINSTSGSDNGYGFFGYNAGTIKNLGIVSGNINLPGVADDVGGIAGYNTGEITYCYNYGCNITGRDRVGGIAGNNPGNIHECFSTGNIKATNASAGGIAGDNGGTVLNCYNTGDIEAKDWLGGVVGYNSNTETTHGVVKNTYNVGKINGTENPGGGVVGIQHGTVEDCFYLEGKASFGISDNGGSDTGAKSLSEDEFKDQSIFKNAGWDFNDIWIMSTKLGRPIFGKEIKSEDDLTQEAPKPANPPEDNPNPGKPPAEDPKPDDPKPEDPGQNVKPGTSRPIPSEAPQFSPTSSDKSSANAGNDDDVSSEAGIYESSESSNKIVYVGIIITISIAAVIWMILRKRIRSKD
ncbi:MAG: hypothetical protein J1E40_10785 [Oscillospiraceae bacterium]|nr:hypothetical protein [Oscillospiraceae bacterium]